MTAATEPGAQLLYAENISKSFGPVKVLHEARLQVLPGRIHGLVGANGSGKSTLIKVLAGYHAPDPGGTLEVHGREIALPLSTDDPRRLGIGFVHQDLGLADGISVLENLLVRRFAVKRGGRIDWSLERKRAGDELERMGIDLPLDAKVSSLSSVQRALVAIARALGAADDKRGGIVFLDEPTAYLPQDGLDVLYSTLRGLAGEGHGIVVVSHNLPEVIGLTDHVTVLRGGKIVAEVQTAETDEESLAELMIGRSGLTGDLRRNRSSDAEPTPSADVQLHVKDLSGRGIKPTSFSLMAGEILGMTGLLGSGFDEVPYLLFGARPVESGTLTIDGRDVELKRLTPDDAIKSGLALLPANRLRDSAIQSSTAAENATMVTLRNYFKGGWLRTKQVNQRTGELMKDYGVSPTRPSAKLSSYSGGNQQKILVAKWVEAQPRVMLLHEPGQGVDIGARVEIFARLRRLAADAGVGMIVASSEYADLANLCDRVIIWKRGEIVSEIEQADLSEDSLAEACLI